MWTAAPWVLPARNPFNRGTRKCLAPQRFSAIREPNGGAWKTISNFLDSSTKCNAVRFSLLLEGFVGRSAFSRSVVDFVDDLVDVGLCEVRFDAPFLMWHSRPRL